MLHYLVWMLADRAKPRLEWAAMPKIGTHPKTAVDYTWLPVPAVIGPINNSASFARW